MHLLFTGKLSGEVLQAVCSTLIHSLWQGLIAAVMAALVVTFTKRSAASVRYNLLTTVLFLFVLSISITAIRQLLSQGKPEEVAVAAYSKINSHLPVNSDTGGSFATDGVAQENLIEQFNGCCNEHASMIVLIWFFLFLIKCSQLLTGLRYIHRLRYRNNYEVSFYWKDRLLQLAKKTGIRRTIIFLESELVKVPGVIGFLKPVLLVPAGLLSHLPPEQVEAILIHELAHILRRDFLVNLLQSFIETLFFFNPAIAWVSALIREEREACCDDMVIAHIPQKNSYLQALVSFQELSFYSKAGAMALTGNRHYLFNRVRRMLTLENKKLNLMEKTVLLLSIIGITAFGFITKEAKQNPAPAVVSKKEASQLISRATEPVTPVPLIQKPEIKKKKPVTLSIPKPEQDTLPKSTIKQNGDRSFPSISLNTKSDGKSTESQIEATDNEGKQYSIKRVDGQITQLTVNGTAVPQNQYSDYSEVIGQIDKAQRLRNLKRKEDLELRKADLFARQKDKQEKREELAKMKRDELGKKNEFKKELKRENDLKREENRKLVEQKNELRKTEYRQKKEETMQMKKLSDLNKTETLQKKKLFTRERTSNDDISRIISDLNNQKLVPDKDNVSFSLTSNELIVNGTKQPAEVHQQFKQKYIQNSGDRFNYSRRGNTTSITINKE